jgi:hypothetical protein
LHASSWIPFYIHHHQSFWETWTSAVNTSLGCSASGTEAIVNVDDVDIDTLHHRGRHSIYGNVCGDDGRVVPRRRQESPSDVDPTLALFLYNQHR